VRRLASPLILVLLLTAGCGTVAGVDWGDSWTDAQGDDAPDAVIHSTLGGTHCDWESVVILYVRWRGAHQRMMYVRDPHGKTGTNSFETTFDRSISLPRAARFSGFRRDEVELWISEATFEREVYLVFSDRVERWPRADPEFGCT
jgi:hypothetical protein